MVELERVTCSNPSDGADVVLLKDITDKPCIGLTCDVPEERAFFLEEEFATFGCLETFGDNCCEFRLISQIPWMDHYAWAIFNTHKLTLERGDVARKQHGKYAFVSQSFAFELPEGEDFGYFQLICLPDQILYDGMVFWKFDLLTFMVYRNRKVRRLMVSPHVVTLHPEADQTYLPIVPGQHLQLVVSDEETIEADEELFEPVASSHKLFTLGRGGKQDRLQATTYTCLSQEGTMFVGKKMVTTTRFLDEDNGTFINILKPSGDAAIYSENINGVHMVCPTKEQWAWDDEAMELEETPDGIDILLKKKVNGLNLQFDKGIWWVFASKNVVGTI